MSRRPDAAFIAAHIDQSPPEAEQLLNGLLRLSWPGGHPDRFEPVAAEWLRRWAPGRGTVAPGLGRRGSVETADCSCAAGRCGICN